MSKFLHHNVVDNDNAKAIAILWVFFFSENSQRNKTIAITKDDEQPPTALCQEISPCYRVLTCTSLTLYSIDIHFEASTTDSFWKYCGKRTNCSSSFPTTFSTQSDNCTPLVQIFDIILLFAAELEEPKIGI